MIVLLKKYISRVIKDNLKFKKGHLSFIPIFQEVSKFTFQIHIQNVINLSSQFEGLQKGGCYDAFQSWLT